MEMDMQGQVLYISNSLADLGEYATFNQVVQNLLQWHHVFLFADIPGCRFISPMNIPILSYLHQIESLLSTFISSYVSSRHITTLYDLENDAIDMLQSYGLAISQFIRINDASSNATHSIIQSNPEEICIDDVEDIKEPLNRTLNENPDSEMPQLASKSRTKFETLFGVGPFLKHPSICNYFAKTMNLKREQPFKETDVLDHLLQFISNQNTNQDYNDNQINGTEGVVVSNFISFICEMEQVQDVVTELGLLCRAGRDGIHGLDGHCSMIRHVIRTRSQRHATLLNKLLQSNDWEKDVFVGRNNVVVNEKKRKSSNKRKKQGRGKAKKEMNEFNCLSEINVSLKHPLKESISSFVESCASLTDGSYSPSFSKVRCSISNQLSNIQNIQDISKKKRKQMKVEKESNIETNEGSWFDQVLDAATEYAMLHLGDPKYKQRAFLLSTANGNDSGVSGGDGDISLRTQEQYGGVKENVNSEKARREAREGSDEEDDDGADDDVDDDDDVDVDGDDGRVNEREEKVEKEEEEQEQEHDVCIGIKNEPQVTEAKRAVITHSNIKREKALVLNTKSTSSHETEVGEVVEDPSNLWDITVKPVAQSQFYDETFKPFYQPSQQMNTIVGVGYDQSSMPWGLAPLNPCDRRAVGKWGEAFIFQLLLKKYPPHSGAVVSWVNQEVESLAPYDIKVTFNGADSLNTGWIKQAKHPRRHETIYIEVKSTSSETLDTFDLSLQEWEFFTTAVSSSLVTYHIYRVFGAGSPSSVRVRVVEDVIASINSKKVRLCLKV